MAIGARPKATVGEPNYVCKECGYEQDSMGRTCDRCGSIRVVSIELIRNLVGSDWRTKIKWVKTSA